MTPSIDYNTIEFEFPLDDEGKHVGVFSLYRNEVETLTELDVLNNENSFLGLIANLSQHALPYRIGGDADVLPRGQYNFFHILPHSSVWELHAGLNSILFLKCQAGFIQQFVGEVPILNTFLDDVAKGETSILTKPHLAAPPELLDHITELTREHQFKGKARDGYLRAKSGNMLLVALMNSQERNNHALTEVEVAELRLLHQYMVDNLQHLVDTRPLMNLIKIPEEELKGKFKQLFGKSMYEALRTERLEKVEALLRMTNIPIQDIAIKVGYGSLPPMSYAFKSRYGLYPKEYRSMYGAVGRNS